MTEQDTQTRDSSFTAHAEKPSMVFKAETVIRSAMDRISQAPPEKKAQVVKEVIAGLANSVEMMSTEKAALEAKLVGQVLPSDGEEETTPEVDPKAITQEMKAVSVTDTEQSVEEASDFLLKADEVASGLQPENTAAPIEVTKPTPAAVAPETAAKPIEPPAPTVDTKPAAAAPSADTPTSDLLAADDAAARTTDQEPTAAEPKEAEKPAKIEKVGGWRDFTRTIRHALVGGKPPISYYTPEAIAQRDAELAEAAAKKAAKIEAKQNRPPGAISRALNAFDSAAWGNLDKHLAAAKASVDHDPATPAHSEEAADHQPAAVPEGATSDTPAEATPPAADTTVPSEATAPPVEPAPEAKTDEQIVNEFLNLMNLDLDHTATLDVANLPKDEVGSELADLMQLLIWLATAPRKEGEPDVSTLATDLMIPIWPVTSSEIAKIPELKSYMQSLQAKYDTFMDNSRNTVPLPIKKYLHAKLPLVEKTFKVLAKRFENEHLKA